MMRKITFQLFGVLFVLGSSVQGRVERDAVGEGQCIWYGTCDENPEKPGLLLNCQYDGPAKPLDDENSLKNLAYHCPEMLAESTGEDGIVRTCCDSVSVDIMSQNLALFDSFFRRCPACTNNIKKNFCDLACHPRGSAFMVPTLMYYGNTTLYPQGSVQTVNFHMDMEYRDSSYYSCENVYYPEMNMEAIGMVCGPWGVDQCNPERLFDYFGINSFAPFNITYIYTNFTDTDVDIDDEGKEVTVVPYNQVTVPCYTNGSMHCLCSDCAESCPPIPEPEPPKDHIMVGELRLFAFLLIIVFSIFALVIIILTCCKALPGDNPEDEAACACTRKLPAIFEDALQRGFEKFGRLIAYHPMSTIAFGVLLVTVLGHGVLMLELTTDPVELWASPESRTRLEKDYYDEQFGPFYRTSMLIITTVGLKGFQLNVTDALTSAEFTYNCGPVFNDTFMQDVMDLQLEIMGLVGYDDDEEVRLTDVCINPLAPQVENECLIQSIMNYWQNDKDKLLAMMTEESPLEYLDHMLVCTSNPTNVDGDYCLGSYGGPVLPYVALGGFLEEGQTLADSPNYEESTAIVITFLNTNYADKTKLGPVLAWEERFIEFMKNFHHPNMDIAFYSERSIEDELIRESKSDIATILLSYVLMFAYISISLGGISTDCGRLMIETKLSLALGGVTIVFLSVVASIGFYGYAGVKATLFVIEVIPFLVLAVGVDNIFLLVQTHQRIAVEPDETVEDHISRVVGRVGPSLLLASSAEAICFFLGGLSDMPAVYAFALYAGMAITIDFILQITCFVALLTLDTKRIVNNRYDVLCCVTGPKAKPSRKDWDICYSIFNDVYGPFILKDFMRALILLTFVGGFFTSIIITPKITVGLEQDISMPDDSYILKYFEYLNDYLSVGSPIYFVVKEGFDYTHIEQQNLICSSSGCNDDSMLSQIFVASLNPSVSYVASGASSWLEAYFTYLADDGTGWPPLACCRLMANGTFVDSAMQVDPNAVEICLANDDFVNGTVRPKPQFFMEFLPYFLIDNPHEMYCPQAGHPAYGLAVNVEYSGVPYDFVSQLTDKWGSLARNHSSEISGIIDAMNVTEFPELPKRVPAHPLNQSSVGASYFMAYHSILKTSQDYTNGLERVYNLTDQIQEYLRRESSNPEIEVFPYSIFYVYYEQYLTMWKTVGVSLAISFVSVFCVMLCISGFDFKSSFINVCVIIMIIVDMIACMHGWNIDLNAISLVNLVMAVGISVEFVSHITHAFALTLHGSKKQRAQKALSLTGSSILSGITLTKFVGIMVLGFANSQIFIIFYFRMYLLMVVVGAAHGLIFLPVLLSLVGPAPNPNFKYIGRDLFKAQQQQNPRHEVVKAYENHAMTDK